MQPELAPTGSGRGAATLERERRALEHLAAVAERGGETPLHAELARVLGVTPESARRIVERLAAMGAIRILGAGPVWAERRIEIAATGACTASPKTALRRRHATLAAHAAEHNALRAAEQNTLHAAGPRRPKAPPARLAGRCFLDDAAAWRDRGSPERLPAPPERASGSGSSLDMPQGSAGVRIAARPRA